MLETVESISTLLWSIVGIIGAIILLWSLWQIVQIVRNLREYGIDYIGFLRGELYAIANKYKVTILKPYQRRGRIHTILWEEKLEKEEMEEKKK